MTQLARCKNSLKLSHNFKSITYLESLIYLLEYLGVDIDYRQKRSSYYVSMTQFYLTKNPDSFVSFIYDSSSRDEATSIWLVNDKGSVEFIKSIYCFIYGENNSSLVKTAADIYRFRESFNKNP